MPSMFVTRLLVTLVNAVVGEVLDFRRNAAFAHGIVFAFGYTFQFDCI